MRIDGDFCRLSTEGIGKSCFARDQISITPENNQIINITYINNRSFLSKMLDLENSPQLEKFTKFVYNQKQEVEQCNDDEDS